jgi:hypothetical protein
LDTAIKSREEYSVFVMTQLLEYISTPRVLLYRRPVFSRISSCSATGPSVSRRVQYVSPCRRRRSDFLRAKNAQRSSALPIDFIGLCLSCLKARLRTFVCVQKIEKTFCDRKIGAKPEKSAQHVAALEALREAR